MGQQLDRRPGTPVGTPFSADESRAHTARVREGIDVLAEMVRGGRLDGAGNTLGLEIELNLVDSGCAPAMSGTDVLSVLADPGFQPELGRFNLEVNVPPRSLDGGGLAELERDVRASLNGAEDKARSLGARIVMVGILPTLMQEQLTADALSPNPRYALLNEQILAARGGDLPLDVTGVETLSTRADTIAPEAACTSAQCHIQVAPELFPAYWNAAQALAGIQLALGANSPFLFGKQLWAETRIVLFQQATDPRSAEHKAAGHRPRVWFGERWIDSVVDLFEENLRYFPPLLPVVEDEDPREAVSAGMAPRLGELRLHNGTIYRWNRPVYDVAHGRGHLRVENRVLPAGPSVVDVVANAAFFCGAVRCLAEKEQVWRDLPFAAAEENFLRGARDGVAARVFWPGYGEVPALEVVRRSLLPAAAAGLDAWGMDPAVRDRLLAVIEGRCRTGRNGASWQTTVVRTLQERGGLDRSAALHRMLASYIDNMHENLPVHDWPLP